MAIAGYSTTANPQKSLPEHLSRGASLAKHWQWGSETKCMKKATVLTSGI